MKIWLAIFSGIAVFNSLCLGIYLIFTKQGILRNRLLGLLLLAAGLRIGKSIVILFYPKIHDAIPAIGIVGMASMGPLVLLYSQSLIRRNFTWRSRYWGHFALPFSIGVTLMFVSPQVIFWLYFIASLQLGGYIGVTYHQTQSLSGKDTSTQWLRLVLFSLAAIWLAFSIQLFNDTLPVYLAGTAISAALLYILIFYASRQSKLTPRVKNIILDPIKSNILRERIVRLFEEDKIYQEPDLTISKLSGLVKEKPYIISHFVNEEFKKSFPEFINYYRIRESERLLLSPLHQHISIEAVALDCGFNSLSVFYQAFKKAHGITPKEFRSKFHSNDQAAILKDN